MWINVAVLCCPGLHICALHIRPGADPEHVTVRWKADG